MDSDGPALRLAVESADTLHWSPALRPNSRAPSPQKGLENQESDPQDDTKPLTYSDITDADTLLPITTNSLGATSFEQYAPEISTGVADEPDSIIAAHSEQEHDTAISQQPDMSSPTSLYQRTSSGAEEALEPINHNYEYQAETTALQQAVQEGESVPLLDNAVDAPVVVETFSTEAEEVAGDAIPVQVNAWPDESTGDTVATLIGTPTVAEPGDVSLDTDWGPSEHTDFDFVAQGDTAQAEADFEAAFAEVGSAQEMLADSDNSQALPAQIEDEARESAWDSLFDDEELLDETAAPIAPAFFEDDGEGFLDDLETVSNQKSSMAAASSVSDLQRGAPSSSATSGNPYAPTNSVVTSARPTAGALFSAASGLGSQNVYGQPQLDRSTSEQSFADKAKTGYASPYDLPETLTKPRRKPAGPGMSRQISATGPAAPPRTTSLGSIGSVDLQQVQSVPGQGNNPTNFGSSRPQTSGGIAPAGNVEKRMALQRSPTAPQGPSSSFFEDLPVTSRPRAPAPAGRYAPQSSSQPPPPSQEYFPSFPPPGQASNLNGQVGPSYRIPGQQNQSFAAGPYAQLRQPDRPPMFPDQPTQAPLGYVSPSISPNTGSQMAPQAVPNTRYSPAPNAAVGSTNASGRYSVDGSGPPKPPVRSFAPRTSSPLAQVTSTEDTSNPNATQRSTISASNDSQLSQQVDDPMNSLRRSSQGSLAGIAATGMSYSNVDVASPPPFTAQTALSPRKRSTYAPSNQLPSVSETGIVPPPRSQSQSPGSQVRTQAFGAPHIHRPASAFDTVPFGNASLGQVQQRVVRHQRGRSQERQFMPPQDERAGDPLERWKGCPIFCWGPGNRTLSSFPNQIPRYSGSQTFYTSTPGTLNLLDAKTVIPTKQSIAGFPGPLRKSKKKDVIAWLKSGIASIENDNGVTSNVTHDVHARQRMVEKLLLWKVLLLLVEHDGALEGSPVVQDAVRAVLQPHVASKASTTSAGAGNSASVVGEAVKPDTLETIRSLLAQGDREQAVWLAADERLWGHAMLISSTLSRDLWQKVTQEFVRKEVKSAGSNHAPLSALYEVFAGNWEESVDQLVPASARAGFKMVSTAAVSGQEQDASAGLQNWQETLLLILGNRTPEDHQAIVALGRLLGSYGRIEAAHICYLFARHNISIAGVENLDCHITLLGLDVKSLTSTSEVSLASDALSEAVMLTEIFELALSGTASTVNPLPHLQAYKLYHAATLAEAGFKTEAQQYCDSISSLVGSKTKRSPYYNSVFEQQLEDLSKRLTQAPTTSSSWITKPTMDKMGSSFYTKLNNFITGDDSDVASNVSGIGNAEVGPFARIAGDSPTISRTTSAINLHDTYSSSAPAYGSLPNAAASSRYAPNSNNAYSQRTSFEQARPSYMPSSSRTSLESTRLGESAISPAGPETNPYSHIGSPPLPVQPAPNITEPFSGANSFSPPRQPLRTMSSQGSATINGFGSGAANPFSVGTPPSNQYSPAYQATPEPESSAPQPGSVPASLNHPSQYAQQSIHNGAVSELSNGLMRPGYQPLPSQTSIPAVSDLDYQNPIENGSHVTSFDEPMSTYEPPTSTYVPPSYQPLDNVAETSPSDDIGEDVNTKPKPKSFMYDDDDDDLAARAAALKISSKSANDKAADDAFKKAAEEDAKRASNPNQKGSWFGGWFGGKKDPNAPQSGPIKAKLGEENSFVYDPELKKWINKKAGAEQQVAAAPTPPPPRGPAMGRGTPPPGAGLRVASGPQGMPDVGPPGPRAAPPLQRAASAALPSTANGSFAPNPLSRSGTPAAGGAAPPELSAAMLPPASAKPPSRPSTSMSNASSIDDLIGPAMARKGAAKKKGRGGRYVDIMANNSNPAT